MQEMVLHWMKPLSGTGSTPGEAASFSKPLCHPQGHALHSTGSKHPSPPPPTHHSSFTCTSDDKIIFQIVPLLRLESVLLQDGRCDEAGNGTACDAGITYGHWFESWLPPFWPSLLLTPGKAVEEGLCVWVLTLLASARPSHGHCSPVRNEAAHGRSLSASNSSSVTVPFKSTLTNSLVFNFSLAWFYLPN